MSTLQPRQCSSLLGVDNVIVLYNLRPQQGAAGLQVLFAFVLLCRLLNMSGNVAGGNWHPTESLC
jgi:hypothetical protein